MEYTRLMIAITKNYISEKIVFMKILFLTNFFEGMIHQCGYTGMMIKMKKFLEKIIFLENVFSIKVFE